MKRLRSTGMQSNNYLVVQVGQRLSRVYERDRFVASQCYLNVGQRKSPAAVRVGLRPLWAHAQVCDLYGLTPKKANYVGPSKLTFTMGTTQKPCRRSSRSATCMGSRPSLRPLWAHAQENELRGAFTAYIHNGHNRGGRPCRSTARSPAATRLVLSSHPHSIKMGWGKLSHSHGC